MWNLEFDVRRSTLCGRYSLQICNSFRACLESDRAPFCRHFVHCSILAWAPACSTLLIDFNSPFRSSCIDSKIFQGLYTLYIVLHCFALFYMFLINCLLWKRPTHPKDARWTNTPNLRVFGARDVASLVSDLTGLTANDCKIVSCQAPETLKKLAYAGCDQ